MIIDQIKLFQYLIIKMMRYVKKSLVLNNSLYHNASRRHKADKITFILYIGTLHLWSITLLPGQ